MRVYEGNDGDVAVRIIVPPSDKVAVHGVDEAVEFECVVNARSLYISSRSSVILSCFLTELLTVPASLLSYIHFILITNMCTLSILHDCQKLNNSNVLSIPALIVYYILLFGVTRSSNGSVVNATELQTWVQLPLTNRATHFVQYAMVWLT